MSNEIQIDAFPPPKMAARMEEVGVTKAKLNFGTMFVLAILAGAFIGAGAIYATVTSTGLAAAGMGYGLVRLFTGLTFCLGLIAVVVAGAELFTGNNLLVMAFASGRITWKQLLRNWVIVYTGNFVGSILTAVVMLLSKQFTFANGAVGANALGIMCNALVCLAVWLCSSARSTTDKILAIVFPISAFVAAGFEHSIANMYFIPMGLLIKGFAPATFWTAIGKTAADFANLTWANFFIKNLLPVTIGNIIGGSGFVGLVYWFAYLRPQKKVEVAKEAALQVLVVDDDPDFLEITRSILGAQGYKVTTASDGDSALDAMKRQKPDVVLLDIIMETPLSGVNVARKMSADPALA
jgi:formate/nitrite transporter FocA (FNT family)